MMTDPRCVWVWGCLGGGGGDAVSKGKDRQGDVLNSQSAADVWFGKSRAYCLLAVVLVARAVRH